MGEGGVACSLGLRLYLLVGSIVVWVVWMFRYIYLVFVSANNDLCMYKVSTYLTT